MECWSAIAAVFLLVVCLGTARAQSPQAAPQSARMARLTYVTGQVELSTANGANPQPAVQNVPILEGAMLSAAFDGQAELEFEDGSVVRMTPNTELSVARLAVDDQGNFQTRLELLHGLIYTELRSSPHFQYSVDAQGDTVTPLENSTVRVDLDQPPAAIAVLDGRVRVTSVGPDGQQGQEAEVSAGQTLRREGLGEQTASVQYLLKDGIDPDSWDQWNRDRDRAAAEEAANRTPARDGFAGDQGYGWSDLDANGSWYNLPGQGPVWQPDLAAGGGIDTFDPYGYGSWSWTSGFGYVWASGYPWGWTPYRCGNWQYWGGFGWGWAPGSACGRCGFEGRGFRVNLRNVPKIYHGPHPPPTGPVPARPLVAVNGGRAPMQRIDHVRGPRVINGVAVQPLRPVGGSTFAGNGNGFGAALHRDFPINRTTHQPVIGALPQHTAPAAAFAGGARANWRPAVTPASGVVLRSQAPQVPRGTYVPPATMQVAPGGRTQVPAPIYSRPQVPQYTVPAMPQRSAPPMPPRPMPAPAPMNTVPPAAPRYTPPPAAPHYSPPPPMAAPHYSAPAPAAAPRMAAPPPSPPAGAPRGR